MFEISMQQNPGEETIVIETSEPVIFNQEEPTQSEVQQPIRSQEVRNAELSDPVFALVVGGLAAFGVLGSWANSRSKQANRS